MQEGDLKDGGTVIEFPDPEPFFCVYCGRSTIDGKPPTETHAKGCPLVMKSGAVFVPKTPPRFVLCRGMVVEVNP